ncbi:hypothetical protein [Sinorhizobium meliloti]|uniref:hypothetical protein n=1 Tax=Rhizobium meliloti TaxID=382 RepID=UPI002350D4A5|nr:hypothetical protein [Sinorhizobium meliloti]
MVSVAVIIALGVNSDGRREVLTCRPALLKRSRSGPADAPRIGRREAHRLGCPRGP